MSGSIVAETVTRVVAFIALVALALLGLTAAVFSIQAPGQPLSLGELAVHLELPALYQVVDDWTGRLEESGGLAGWSALGCSIAMLAGTALIGAALFPRRARFVVVTDDEEGTLRYERQAVADLLAAEARRVSGVVDASVDVHARRWQTGGRAAVAVAAAHGANRDQLATRVNGQLAPMAASLQLRLRTRCKGKTGWAG